MASYGAGFEYPPQEVSWLKRDVLLFANSIGCTVDELHFLYELHPDFSVFPTYPVVLPFKGSSQEVVDFYASQEEISIPGVPKFDYRRVVDGRRMMQFFRPLPATSAGRRFEARTTVLGVYDKGDPGSVLESETDLVEVDSGDIYSRVTTSSFFVGQGNWNGPRGRPADRFLPAEGEAPDLVLEHDTKGECSLLYRLNGDYNPLHATAEPGTSMGFRGAITHGLYQWNVVCHELLKALGESNPRNLRQFEARFSSPVRPGDKLMTRVWRIGTQGAGWQTLAFVTEVAGGRVCLSDGRAVMKCVGADAASRL